MYSSIYLSSSFRHLLCFLSWAISPMATFGHLDSSMFGTLPAHFSFRFACSELIVCHPRSSLRPVALAHGPILVSYFAILFWIDSMSLIYPWDVCITSVAYKAFCLTTWFHRTLHVRKWLKDCPALALRILACLLIICVFSFNSVSPRCSFTAVPLYM